MMETKLAIAMVSLASVRSFGASAASMVSDEQVGQMKLQPLY